MMTRVEVDSNYLGVDSLSNIFLGSHYKGPKIQNMMDERIRLLIPYCKIGFY